MTQREDAPKVEAVLSGLLLTVPFQLYRLKLLHPVIGMATPKIAPNVEQLPRGIHTCGAWEVYGAMFPGMLSWWQAAACSNKNVLVGIAFMAPISEDHPKARPNHGFLHGDCRRLDMGTDFLRVPSGTFARVKHWSLSEIFLNLKVFFEVSCISTYTLEVSVCSTCRLK